MQIDAVHHAVMGDVEALVDLAFAVHPLAALRLAHQLGEAVLQHAGADSRQHVFAAVLFQHDVSMPCRCRSCDSNSPDGPPPMMQTWTFIFTPSLDFGTYLLDFWLPRMDGVIGLCLGQFRTWPRRRRTEPFSTYNLFGEAGDLPDVVHCETIAARSVLHEWEFAPTGMRGCISFC